MSFFKKKTDLLQRLFPERQVFYRSRGEVRFVRLTRRKQYLLAGALLVVFGWFAFATGSYLVNSSLRAEKDGYLAALDARFQAQAERLQMAERRFAETTGELEAKRAQLQALLGERDILESEVSDLKESVAGLSANRQHNLAATQEVAVRIKALETELLRTKAAKINAEGRLASMYDEAAKTAALRQEEKARVKAVEAKTRRLEAVLAEAARQREELQKQLAASKANEEAARVVQEQVRISNARIAELKGELNTNQGNTEKLRADMARLESRLEAATRFRRVARMSTREAARMSEEQNSRVQALENRLAAIGSAQQALVERVQSRTQSSIQKLEEALGMTGVDLESMLAAVENVPNGQGGPLVTTGVKSPKEQSSEDLPAEIGGELENSFARLETHMARWAGLQQLVANMPLVRPVNMGYVSSAFGKRRDPIAKRRAIHNGVDYAGFKNMPVYSTAEGRVSFAGRNGAFGLMVEIDHGFGLKTRYAHLNKILVKKGERVADRQKIGLMGSTGRSTGPHVHYEILYRGKPQDPAKFIKAGQYVLKG